VHGAFDENWDILAEGFGVLSIARGNQGKEESLYWSMIIMAINICNSLVQFSEGILFMA